MRKLKPLDALLPKTRQGILAALLVQPGKTWYVSELARRMGVPSSSLQRELLDLTTAGILKTHRQGRMVYFQANADSPIFPDLRGLLLKTAGLVDVLADVLKPVASKMGVAFIYGSAASGGEQSDSDIDLMLVGGVTPMELAVPLRRARELLGRDINPTVYTPVEFRRKRTAKDHFLTRILDKPKLFVKGSVDELESLRSIVTRIDYIAE
jgi:DNA-binding transcriptional ArsR family regulator/predicted nucleotidyltransferase